MHIPFVDLTAQYQSIKYEIDEAIKNVISDSAFIGGKYVENFKFEFSKLYGVKYCIPCANGTDAIYITLKMLGIGPGDEVITVGNSWISTSETITQVGAKVIFVDCDEYFTIDDKKIEEKISKKTKAIIPVHLYGQMANINNIKKICDKFGLHLIEDCAQSHFSELNSIKAGHTGIASTFSFFPGKNLGAYGDAGAILTNDKSLAESCTAFANHGALVKHLHNIEGINSRMDGIQAAILLAKLPYILQWTEKRIIAANYYNKILKEIPQIEIPKIREGSKHSYHLYVIKAEKRDQLGAFLRENGIEVAVHYPTPLPFMNAYSYLNHCENDFPLISDNKSKILSLPIFPEISTNQQEYIYKKIKEFYKIQ